MQYVSLKECDEPLGQFLEGIATQPVGVPYVRRGQTHHTEVKRNARGWLMWNQWKRSWKSN